jgi:4-hydroxy-tetrahydrodipicolinate reductase
MGRVGRDVCRILAQRPGYRVVSAYSRNSAHQDRDVGELSDAEPLGVQVSPDREQCLEVPTDIVVVATTSFVADVFDDLVAAANHGANVICTAEEMVYPQLNHAERADELDRVALANGVTILGGGVNPGFIFDALVLSLSGAAPAVDAIKVTRRVGFAGFSETVRHRLGIGYQVAEFNLGADAGTIHGHIGFPESMALVADKLKVEIERFEKELSALPASRDYELHDGRVAEGETAGFLQREVAVVQGRPWFTAELLGHLEPESLGTEIMDTIDIDGPQPVRVRIVPGLKPQVSAASTVANSLRRVVMAPAGLTNVGDLPPATSTAATSSGS